MLTEHINDDLTAYCRGDLAPAESRRVGEHLLQCESCRADYEEVRAGIGHLAALPLVSPRPDLWDAIERELDGTSAVAPEASPAARRSWAKFGAIAAGLLLLACAGLAWYAMRSTGPVWSVRSIDGSPVVDARRIGDTASFATGQLLETDANSRAEIQVGAIGTCEVEPNSRVRLMDAKLTEHRIALDRGTLHARIWAPPRLFFVDTPSAVAVDYGCAYTLTVDDRGATALRVTLGWVALELGNREAMVPAGAVCETRPGIGPGTPYFDDASPALRSALARFDFENGGQDAVDTVVGESRSRDSLTLWHLLAKVEGAERQRVYDRLAAYVPPPAGVSREKVLALDNSALDAWRLELRGTW